MLKRYAKSIGKLETHGETGSVIEERSANSGSIDASVDYVHITTHSPAEKIIYFILFTMIALCIDFCAIYFKTDIWSTEMRREERLTWGIDPSAVDHLTSVKEIPSGFVP